MSTILAIRKKIFKSVFLSVSLKLNNINKDINKGLYVYKILPENDTFEYLNSKPFNNISEVQKCLQIQITKQTILKYIDTFVQYKNYLFFSVDLLNIKKEKLKNFNLLKPKPLQPLRQPCNVPLTVTEVNVYPISLITSFQSIIQARSVKILPINYIPNYLSKLVWVYKVDFLVQDSVKTVRNSSVANEAKVKDLILIKDKPFNTISEASLYLNVSRSTIVNILDKNIAMSKGYLCFSNSLSNELKSKLISNLKIRDPISSLTIKIWVYDYSLNLINGKPFNSQSDMLRKLGLKRIRSINKYKDKGILFKNYYFSSNELTDLEKNKILLNRDFAIPNIKAKLVWVYLDEQLINGKPFLSLIKAGEALKINRKIIASYLDTNKYYNGYKFWSKSQI